MHLARKIYKAGIFDVPEELVQLEFRTDKSSCAITS